VVLIRAASFDELEREDARRADAVVFACRARADQRAAAIRAARINLPNANIIVIATAEFDEGPHGGGEPVQLIPDHDSDAVSNGSSAGRVEHGPWQPPDLA
jgi:hypothetical protein